MWRMKYLWRDCMWLIISPLDIIVKRTYNRKMALMLLDQHKTECPYKEPKSKWKGSNDGEEEKTKNEEEEDICPDD